MACGSSLLCKQQQVQVGEQVQVAFLSTNFMPILIGVLYINQNEKKQKDEQASLVLAHSETAGPPGS